MVERKECPVLPQYCKWNWHFIHPASKISNTELHDWCYGDHDFTQLSHLLCSFRNTQQLSEWKDQSTVQLVVSNVFVFCCSLEDNAEHCNHDSAFESTPLMCNIGASLGLTPCKADFFDYVDMGFYIYGHLRSHSSKWSQDKQLI